LLALAVILDGGSRSDAGKAGGVALQIVRDGDFRFNEAGPDGLITCKARGKASILNDEQRRALAEVAEAGPIPAEHGAVRLRLIDLTQWIWDEFGLSVTRFTLGREPRAPGYRKLSARPRHHAQKPDDITDCSSIRPDGTSQGRSLCPRTSHCYRSRQNSCRNLWQFMRENWLSNRIFKSYEDIVDHCCFAWNALVDRPWRITAVGLRQWALEF
jgi:transposase